MSNLYLEILKVDDLFKNKNLLNSQNYLITKKIKKRAILNFLQIKTKVNGRYIIKYRTLGKYKIINFNEIKKENLINNLLFLLLPTSFILVGLFVEDIDLFSRLFLIGFSILFTYLFLNSDKRSDYRLLRDRNLVYVKNK